MEKEIEFATQLIRGDIYHLSQRVENIARKPRRKCIGRNLACLPSGEIVVINRFDDGSRTVVGCFIGVRGPWKAYQVIIKEMDWSVPLFALHFEGSGDWIVGRFEKLRGNYLYELFIRAGIRFEMNIPRSELKRVIQEEFTGEICITENKFRISVLAGWNQGKMQYTENYLLGMAEDVKNFPVLKKSFKKLNLTDDAIIAYFKEMRCIRNEKDRLIIMTYSLLSMIASILRKSGKKLCFGINFIMLSPFDKERVCAWFQIFNRDCCVPLNGGMTGTKFEKVLRTIKDETVMLNCTIHDDEMAYEKNKKNITLKKIYSVILGEECLEGRLNEPVYGGVVTFSNRFLHGKEVFNMYVTENWCKEREENRFMENEVMERIYSELSQYVETENDKVFEFINKRRCSGDERVDVLQIGLDILEDFWRKRGIDFLSEAGINRALNIEEIFGIEFCDEEELLEQFVYSVRKEAEKYIFICKRSGENIENVIYYSEEYLWFPTKTFEEILKNRGLYEYKEKILLALKEKEWIETDQDGFTKKLQVGCDRFETYKMRKNMFNKTGNIDIIALGGEGNVD